MRCSRVQIQVSFMFASDRWLLMAVRGHFGGMVTRARATGGPSRGAAPG
jgi:hypothetical protein